MIGKAICRRTSEFPLLGRVVSIGLSVGYITKIKLRLAFKAPQLELTTYRFVLSLHIIAGQMF